MNVGSGAVQSDVSYGKGGESGLRGPATVDSAVREEGAEGGVGVGREGVKNVEGGDGEK